MLVSHVFQKIRTIDLLIFFFQKLGPDLVHNVILFLLIDYYQLVARYLKDLTHERIQDFPKRGEAPIPNGRQPIISPIFSRKLLENEIWGKECASKSYYVDSPLWQKFYLKN